MSFQQLKHSITE